MNSTYTGDLLLGAGFLRPFDIELDNPEPVTWRVHVEYSNDEVQDTESTGSIPDRLNELLFSLSEFFE